MEPWSELFSVSRSGGEDVIQRMGLRSLYAVANPGIPLEKLYSSKLKDIKEMIKRSKELTRYWQ
jgi:hypothetical protein